MAISIHDVACEARLSCETILEGLISPSSLEPEVVRFVMETIRRTGYLETFARWRDVHYRNAVGVLTLGFDSGSDAEAIKGMERVTSALGLTASTIIFPTRRSVPMADGILGTLLELDMASAAITLNIAPSRATVERYAAAGKPLILTQASAPGAQSVLMENQKGVAIAVNYLFQQGRKRIALINGSAKGIEPSAVSAERLLGYITAMQRLGVELDESLVFETSQMGSEGGIEAFSYFASRGALPDAVLCATGDMGAIGFINAAREAGIRVPDDVSVMGYEDLPIAAIVQPPLTTIRQRIMIAGAAAMTLALESAVNGKGRDLTIVPELIERGSA